MIMRARLAQKILVAKADYQEFIRYDFPYTGHQLYAAAKRAKIPAGVRDTFYRNWHKITKSEGIEDVLQTYGYKLPTNKRKNK